MISTRRAAGTPTWASRRSSERAQSGILEARDAIDCGDEGLPAGALRVEDPPAGGRQAVVPAAPLAGLLDPLPANHAALFQPVQQRVQRSDVIADFPAGFRLDQLADLVAVP